MDEQPQPPSSAKSLPVASSSPGRENFNIPSWLPEKWQSIADTIAELANVPVGLVMRVVGDDIEVLVSSRTIGNPYKPGEAMRLPDSGLYCEHVIRSNEMLAVPNALADPHWKDNPDVDLGMISYLGVPVRWPDDRPFGTLCILDNQEHTYAEIFERLLKQFRDIIEHHLSLIYTDSLRELAIAADRKRHDELLQSSEQRFRLLVEHAADDFILHDSEGRILDANHQAARNAGMTKDELRSANILTLPIAFGDSWDAAVWNAAQPGAADTFEASYALASGQLASIEIRWSCQLMQGEKLFLILLRDVSERHRAEEAMRVAEAELARASRLTMMGQLAGSIVHEINQPLAAIATRAEACLRWLERGEPRIDQAKESARLLSQSARDASEIVSSLRSIAQRSNPVHTQVEINDVIREALLLTRRECSTSGVTRSTMLASEPLSVMGDPVQIKQVFLNLILNGLEAQREVADGRRGLAISSTRTNDGRILVTVEDYGTGLLGASSAQLFEPLFTTKSRGMGMGLAICQSILQAHGGKIWAEDRTPAPGARFSLSFPPA